MYATNTNTNANVKQAKTPMCSYCRSLGKSVQEYTNHYTHKTPSQNSRITCPELWKRICNSCTSFNHTANRCPKLNAAPVCLPVANKTTSAKNTSAKNRYADLEESDDEDDVVVRPAFNAEHVNTLSPEEKVNYIGDEIYFRIVDKTDPERAVDIINVMIEMELADIIHMLQTPEVFQERLSQVIQQLE
jgi:hypothetical protein